MYSKSGPQMYVYVGVIYIYTYMCTDEHKYVRVYAYTQHTQLDLYICIIGSCYLGIQL